MSYYVENMIDNQITYVEDRMFQNMLPRNLPYGVFKRFVDSQCSIVAFWKKQCPEILC